MSLGVSRSPPCGSRGKRPRRPLGHLYWCKCASTALASTSPSALRHACRELLSSPGTTYVLGCSAADPTGSRDALAE
eukprot:scaffold96649_cov33-Tisochrysis_lutea.AAC.2